MVMDNDLIKEGLYLLEKNKYEEAIELFLKAKRINPKDYLVWWVLGHAYKRNNQYDKAIDCFLKVIELGVTYDSYDYDLYLENKAYIKKPIYENIWYDLGNTYFINDKYKEAIDCYLKSKEIMDASTSYRVNGSPFHYNNIDENIGDAYCKMGQFKEAIDYFLTYKATDGERMIKLANIYYSNGQFNEAVKTLLKSTEAEPCFHYSEICNSLGCLYLMNGDYEKAVDSFLKAPNYIIWSLLGILYILNEQYEEALEPLLTATELNSSSYFTWYYLGFLYYKNKKYKEAIKTLWKAAKLDIFYFKDSYILNSTNNIYCKNGEYKDAGEVFLKNIGIESDGHQLWIMLGHSYYAIGEYDKAKKSYLKANKLNPEDKVSLEMIEKLNPILENKEKEEAEKIEDIFKMANKNHPLL